MKTYILDEKTVEELQQALREGYHYWEMKAREDEKWECFGVLIWERGRAAMFKKLLKIFS